MALERKILTITNPTIPIDTMTMANVDDPNAPLQGTDFKHKQAGAVYPLVQINGHQFEGEEVSSFILDETEFLPKLRVIIETLNGTFLSVSYPKDGDPVSIWIRSKMDEFKPIRADFEITSVNALPSHNEHGDVQRFTIEGVLRVPGLQNASWCNTFGNNTAFDTLIAVAQKVLLGFASNETTTNDKMNWICPFTSYEEFIKDVTIATYKDDDSFFYSFIDHNYFLNLVNVDNQYSEEFEVESALEALTISDDYYKNKQIQKFDTSLFLCNHRNLRGTGNFIQGYTLLNTAGRMVMNNGYRRYVQYYDAYLQGNLPADKYQSYFIESLDTDGINSDSSKILLKGRLINGQQEGNSSFSSFYGDFNKYKWMGPQYSGAQGNCHDNYMHAIIQNVQNEQQIDKMKMRLTLPKCNFNLYRGQRVPVIIINDGDPSRQKATLQPAQNKDEVLSYDKFLTGYYMLQGMVYSWNSDMPFFKQELFLSRREWSIPVQQS